MTSTLAVVVDASTAVAWVADESITPWARSMLAHRLLVPGIFWTECANAFWRIARLDKAGRFDASAALERVMRVPAELVAPEPALTATALALATRLDHPVYDCLYLALALDRGAALATADRRFAAAVTRAAALPADRLLTPPVPA